jgi:uncharacterized damage-inducible protein DinB
MDPMTPAEREHLTSYLSATRRQVLETVQNLAPTQLDYRPGPDRWSPAQIVEHLAIVEGLILFRIDAALKSPQSQQSAWQGRDDELMSAIRSRESRVQAPERVRPTGQLPHDELFRKFNANRNRIIEFAATTDAPLRNMCSPHPIFGDLDCYQWLLAVAAHSERHHAQIREVMADANFPQAADGHA